MHIPTTNNIRLFLVVTGGITVRTLVVLVDKHTLLQDGGNGGRCVYIRIIHKILDNI